MPQTEEDVKRNTYWATTKFADSSLSACHVLLYTSSYIAYCFSSSLFTPISFLKLRTLYKNSLCSFSLFFNFRRTHWIFRNRIL